MLTLSSTLLDVQKQASARPYVRAVLSDYHGGVSRLRFTRHYTGSEGEYYSAVVSPGDGSLVRARIDPSTKVLYTQRVTSPGPPSTYSSWTSQGTVSASGAVALAARDATVFLFYVDADTVTLKVKASSDNGATYGVASTVATAGSAVTYLAAAFATGGDCVLFWNVGAAVWKSRYNGGSWGTPAAWSNSVASVSGLACKYRNDWDLVVCGTATTSLDAKVWTAIYGDGAFQGANTWSSLREVTTATASSNVSFRAPAVEMLAQWRLFFVEKYTGSQAYSRLQLSTMNSVNDYTRDNWREPIAFDYPTTGSGLTTVDYGVAVATTAGYLWLSAPAGVWSAPSPSWSDLDVSADVVGAEVELSETDGRARLVLRNDPSATSAPAGRYSAYGSGALAALRRGARVSLAPGYRTTAGDEAPAEPAYWVEAIEQQTGAQPALTLHLGDAWWLLEQWRARRQFVWAAGSNSVAQLLEYICARAGLDYSLANGSTALGLLKPAFTIQAGENCKTAVRRLLALTPDDAFMRGGTFNLRYPQTSDTTDATFGAGHAIVSARYREDGATTNRVRALGGGVSNEALDFADIEAMGERISQVLDLNLTSTTLAADRAASDLREGQLRNRHDEVRVFGVHCGLELYDVVALTDPQAGLSSAKRRVLGLHWRYTTGDHPAYDQTLTLGSV